LNTGKPAPLIFQHIPKTAGVSLRAVIAANFHIYRIAHVPDQFWRDAHYVTDAANRHDFVHGHLHYDSMAGCAGTARIVTFLRNPIERVRSLYFFMRSQSPTDLKKNSRQQFFVQQAHALPLHEFAAHPDPDIAYMVSNYQVRMLLPAAEDACNDRLQRAIENLEDYHFVGIADPDLIQHSVAELCRLNGWITLSAAQLVNHSVRDSAVDLGDLASQVIAERNQHDIALYHLIRQRFTAKLPAATSTRKVLHPPAIEPPPDSYTTGLGGEVTMDQPLRCWGWHDRESDGSGKYWRCGAARNLGLQLRVPSNTSMFVMLDLISVHPRTAMPRVIAKSLGQPLKSLCLHYDDRWRIGVWVSSSVANPDGELTMELCCTVLNEGEYRPPLVADNRFVTIALERIYIVAGGDAPPPVVEEFLQRSGSWLIRLYQSVKTRIARRRVSRRPLTQRVSSDG